MLGWDGFMKMDNSELWLGKPAPRYTSYPPAPAYHGGISDTDFTRSLSGTNASDPLSLYIHIPFCRSLCLYCGCNTAVTQRHERIENYLDSLKLEMGCLTRHLDGRRYISHIHFGGGTPNILSEKDMGSLLGCVRATYNFSDCHEMAMELDPRIATHAQIKTLAREGFTRVSLGVQDFHTDVQRAIYRVQPYDMVARVCDWLRKSGIKRINFDLIYGLPLQTPATVADTARQVCKLRPDRIALFSYAHVPQMKKHQAVLESYGLPDVHQRLVMEQTAREILVNAGYIEVGMDHFALPDDAMATALKAGKLHRNFQGYTDDVATTMLGLGASSISQTPDGFFQNAHDETDYQNLIQTGQSAIKRGYLLTADDRLRGDIIEQLMCYLACDVGAICQKHHVDAGSLSAEMPALQPFIESGLVARDGYKIRLTAPHRMAIRVVAQVFDNHTPRMASPSSRAA